MGRLAGSGAPLTAIDEATSFFIPGHKYSEKFQNKKWDGKRHLFNLRQQTFPAGLWGRVREALEHHAIEYELEDHFQPPPPPAAPLLNACPPRLMLRDYQEAAVEAALRERRGIIQMATGGGKTLLAAHLLRRIGRPAFFFVHTRDLLYQAARVFEQELGVEVGLLGDGQASVRALTVATIQTALRAFEEAPPARRIARRAPLEDEDEEAEERPVELDDATRRQTCEAIEGAEVVIFDECHHVPADSFYKIAMRTHSAAWRLGLSATPWRDDGHDLLLAAALGEKISVTCCSDLIDRGYLVAPSIAMIAAPKLGLAWRGMSYQDVYQRAIVENQERNRAIAARARQWAGQGRSVLILVAQVAHGRALLEALPEARFVYGALESALRRQYLLELEQKLQPMMIATTLADEGLDLPTLDAVILGGGGKSETRAFQRIGRALRPAAGKTQAQVLDFHDAVPYLRQHSEARLALYRQEPRFKIRAEF